MYKIDTSSDTPVIDDHHDQYLSAPLNEVRPSFLQLASKSDNVILAKMFSKFNKFMFLSQQEINA